MTISSPNGIRDLSPRVQLNVISICMKSHSLWSTKLDRVRLVLIEAGKIKPGMDATSVAIVTVYAELPFFRVQ